MRKFLIIFVAGIMSFDAFCAEPHYNCRYQSENTNKRGRLEKNGEYLYCGHVGTDGCANMDKVVIDDMIYTCSEHNWIIAGYVNPCLYASHGDMLRVGYEYYKNGDNYIYYKRGNDTETLVDYCEMYTLDMKNSCLESGGAWASEIKVGGNFVDGNYCECQHDGTMLVGVHCECQTGLEMDENKKCWPKGWRLKCYSVSDTIYCPDVSGWFNGREFVELPLKHCAFFYSGNNYFRACNIDNDIKHRDGVACDGVSDKVAYDAWNSDNHVIGTDADGLQCLQPATKYNYQTCSNDSDCTNIDNTKRPYLHSTAWHCAWQSAGVRVCTATACESGWTPINGYCQEDKNTQTPQSENKNANSVSNIKTETKTTVKKTCTDLDNMDSNCKCIVAGTVERGGKCVCRDDNQEIKNGKCEWTAKYVAGLESDLDSKFNGLTATIGGFEKNVWRDENGEFNTARLASDSIAGVVLGTVGGIVTANLVKKAQVKQGFEDIGCYIGGQSVAGYGDEFNVGR